MITYRPSCFDGIHGDDSFDETGTCDLCFETSAPVTEDSPF